MACGQPNGLLERLNSFPLQEFNFFIAIQMYASYNKDPSVGGGGRDSIDQCLCD